jgi:putative sterol carrier protein
MSVFKDSQMVEELFGELWTKMINETEFGPKLKEGGITILFYVEDPKAVMYVDANGPIFGDEAEAKIPVVTMKMSGDTVHKYWLKKVNVPKALALREIKAKGPVGKVLQVLPLLKPGQTLYPEYCEKYGLPVE